MKNINYHKEIWCLLSITLELLLILWISKTIYAKITYITSSSSPLSWTYASCPHLKYFMQSEAKTFCHVIFKILQFCAESALGILFGRFKFINVPLFFSIFLFIDFPYSNFCPLPTPFVLVFFSRIVFTLDFCFTSSLVKVDVSVFLILIFVVLLLWYNTHNLCKIRVHKILLFFLYFYIYFNG